MQKLAEIQRQLQQYIFADNSPEIPKIKNNGMAVTDRLDVYRDAFYIRLEQILAKDYETLKTLMGESAFFAMVKNYLQAYPSQDFSVLSVGKNLQQFLAAIDGIHPVFIELAEFEWAFRLAHQAPEIVAKNELHPSVQFCEFKYNTVAIFEAVQNKLSINFEKLSEKQIIILWRRDLMAYYMEISQAEAIFARNLQNAPDALLHDWQIRGIVQIS